MTITFREIADRVLVATVAPLAVNVTLVVGDDRALLVDTLSTEDEAASLLDAVRGLTDKPLTVVNTHFHFDHCFGNAVFADAGCDIWAHEQTAVALAERGDDQRRAGAQHLPALAAGLDAARITVPTHLVRDSHALDLGRRTAELVHFGHGHTDSDLVVLITDAHTDGVAVAVAGDLLEESGPPDFGDAHPLEWPATLGRLIARLHSETVIVPGHGAIVDLRFAREQHNDLSAFEWLIRDGHRDGGSIEKLIELAPYPGETSRPGIERGFTALNAE